MPSTYPNHPNLTFCGCDGGLAIVPAELKFVVGTKVTLTPHARANWQHHVGWPFEASNLIIITAANLRGLAPYEITWPTGTGMITAWVTEADIEPIKEASAPSRGSAVIEPEVGEIWSSSAGPVRIERVSPLFVAQAHGGRTDRPVEVLFHIATNWDHTPEKCLWSSVVERVGCLAGLLHPRFTLPPVIGKRYHTLGGRIVECLFVADGPDAHRYLMAHQGEASRYWVNDRGLSVGPSADILMRDV